MAAIVKSNMADINREFRLAQYLKMFATLMYMCAKFVACITKCTILLNIWAKLPH